ncbi:MAG: MFS transporter [Bacteroidota bacterium]|nr:MFS transporter [Bacteroidota bacterium]
MSQTFTKDLQYAKFCAYGFLKNLKFFEAFLILFFLENGLSFLQIGILYSIREITTNILEIPSGVIADVLGRRKTMIQAFAAYIASFGMFWFSSSFGLFVVAMFLFSIGNAFRSGTHKAMIFEYLKLKGWGNQKVHYYGHTRSWSQMGSAISSLVAAGIVFYSGNYSLVFLFTAIPYILDLLLMFSYPKELDGTRENYYNGQILKSFKEVFRQMIISFSLLEIFKALGSLSLYSGYYKASRDFLQPIIKSMALSLPVFIYLQGEKRSAIFVGVIYFFIFLMTSIISRKSGKISDLFQNLAIPLNLSLLFGFSCGVGAGVFYIYDLYIPAIICFLGIYLIENLRKPMGISYVTDLFDKSILATVLSVESQAISLFAAIIAPLIGWLADMYGLGFAIVGVSLVLLLLSPIVMLGKKV